MAGAPKGKRKSMSHKKETRAKPVTKVKKKI